MMSKYDSEEAMRIIQAWDTDAHTLVKDEEVTSIQAFMFDWATVFNIQEEVLAAEEIHIVATHGAHRYMDALVVYIGAADAPYRVIAHKFPYEDVWHP